MPHRVLMVCDFFFPNTGGVEVHIFSLAQCLLARGHKVVVLTRAYGDRCGVRHMTRGLKVYYAPRLPVYGGATLPGLFGLAPLLRCILLRERITIVHGHTAYRRALADAVAEAAEECLLRRTGQSGRAGKGGRKAAAAADVEAEHAWAQHREVKGMYSWDDIAERVERVYDRAALHSSCEVDRLRRYLRAGPVSGPLFAFVAAADSLFCLILSYIYPASQIDIAPDTHIQLQS